MRFGMVVLALSAIPALLPERVHAQEQLTLTGLARDFAELIPKLPGGHPDFNQTLNSAGVEAYGCFDRPDAGKGAVEIALGAAPVNPDGVAGMLPFDRDDRTPVLKATHASPPNCFRSRFGDWYTTRNPEVNRAFLLDLVFTKSGSNFVYDNSEFFPMDDSKLPSLRPHVPGVTGTFGHRQTGAGDGTSLASHNYGFTFEFHARFTYKRGTGQRFAFRGDDDVWVFINDRLVIDLGGIHASENAEVDCDNLGLTDGQVYPLDFFFAERRVTASRLTITTSLELKTSDKPVDPDPPKPADPVKILEGAYFDRNGDGIADSAEITLDARPGKDPSLLELKLGGEVERGGWEITRLSDTRFSIKAKTGNFFTKPVTSWDEADPANRGRSLRDAATGLSDATFPMKDQIGPVIAKAVKTVEDTTLSAAPTGAVIITFTEPVRVDAPGVLKFKNKAGNEVQVDMTRLEPVDPKDGYAVTWKFTVSPGTPGDPVEGWQVAIGGISQVQDRAGIRAHADNPWKPIETQLPAIYIGGIKAERGVTAADPIPPDTKVGKPFVLLTSNQVTPTHRNYVPLHPDQAEDWIRRIDGSRNPGVVVFNFEISHPAEVELSVFDTQGHFVNKTRTVITREDLLQSGLLSRLPATRAFLIRFAWYPTSYDGALIATGAYILKARFNYGIDPRDNVSKGSRDRILTFGFLRPVDVEGLN